MGFLTRTRRLLMFGWNATRSKYVGNTPRIWDHLYAHRYGELLDGTHQRPRYLYLAGMIEDHFLRGERAILDIGCGIGTLYGLIGRSEIVYQGIDFSQKAVDKARETFGDQFEVADLSAYRPDRLFDIIILNEVLYYLPLRRIPGELQRLRSLLTTSGTLLISMSASPKAAFAWRCCSVLGPPTSRTRVTNTALGISWNIRSFQVAHSKPVSD